MLNELRFTVAFFTPYQLQGWSIIEVLAQEKTLFKATSRDLICITKKWQLWQMENLIGIFKIISEDASIS